MIRHPKQAFFVAFLINTTTAYSLWAASGSQGAAFLEIPVGARPAAMGSAYSALATDAYAPIWNPAGLGFVNAPELAGQHLSYLESTYYEHIGLAVPLRPHTASLGALGFSAQYLGSGNITGRDPSGQSTGDYSSHFGAYSVAYGLPLSEAAAVGITSKWINAQLGDYSANAYAFDLGGLYHLRENMTAALTATNIGTRLKFIQDSDRLPTAVHTGLAYRPWTPILISAEGVFGTDGSANGRFGAEWQPTRTVSIRTGYRTDSLKELSALAGFSTGIGLHFWNQEFSYAWVPYGDLGESQYFSLVIRPGAAEKGKNLAQRPAVDDVEYRQLIELFNNSWPETAQIPDKGQTR